MALAAVTLCAACAAAEEAMEFGGDIFVIANEENGSALVRFDDGEKPLLSERAGEIRDLTLFDGAMYYLRNSGGAWELVRRDPNGGVSVAYTFGNSESASGLSAHGQNLFVLINERLHTIYPSQSLVLQMAGAPMKEYVLVDDFAYFVSAANMASAETVFRGETLAREAGRLCRLNLSTGKTDVILDSGAYDLSYFEGTLYFHSLADNYVSASSDFAELCGKIWVYDIASGLLERRWDDYDWGYAVTKAGLAVRNSDGLWRGGENIAVMSETDEICVINGKITAYDPLNVTIKALE